MRSRVKPSTTWKIVVDDGHRSPERDRGREARSGPCSGKIGLGNDLVDQDAGADRHCQAKQTTEHGQEHEESKLAKHARQAEAKQVRKLERGDREAVG